LYARHGRCL